MKFFALPFLLFLSICTQVFSDELVNKTILMAITPDTKSYFLSKYLSHLENLEYDKKLITIFVDITKTNEEGARILKSWLEKNKNKYHKIIVDGAFDTEIHLAIIKNKGLQKAKELDTDYYFSCDNHVFLAPYTLKDLVNKDKPIIAPLLHAIPGINPLQSNFFADVTPVGFFKEHPDFLSIIHRTIKGTIKVPVINLTYLVKTSEIKNFLNFGNSGDFPFILFSKNARDNGVEIYLTNEKPYGVFIHFEEELSRSEERKKFKIMSPYINTSQEQEKKVVYIKTGYWGDIYDLNCPFYNKVPWIQLRLAGQAAGIDFKQVKSFDDIHHFEKLIVFEIFGDQIPLYGILPKEKVICVLWEPPSVLPENYNSTYHHFFSKIYTWRDDLVDNKKYFKIAYPDLRPMLGNQKKFAEKKLAVLVSSNKVSPHANELYSARREIVQFYSQYYSKDLDLFGPSWPPIPVYKGLISGTLLDKVDKLKSYKFCYAYENVKNEPGYITEKMLNCFQAGCVPIYWGAPNVLKYIPSSCFIDRRKFSSEAEVYAYIKNMKEEEYNKYIASIKAYLRSEKAKIFTIENLIKTFMGMVE